MLVGLAKAEIEVVDPLPIEFSQATPTIARPSEAMQWLNAHHVHSPITRHALVVLESIDAIDLAFDTFVCSLLDGEVDTSGYPEYNAVVGGVAAHWDEATGDMICRAVVGWGGTRRPRRHRPDRRQAAGRSAHQRPGQPARDGPDRHRTAGPGRRSRRPGLRALRVRVGPRAGVLLPQVRHAPPARLTRTRSRRCPATTTPAPPAGDASRSSTASTRTARRRCPLCGSGPRAQGLRRAGHPLQGLGLGQEGAPRDGGLAASSGDGTAREAASRGRSAPMRRQRDGGSTRRRSAAPRKDTRQGHGRDQGRGRATASGRPATDRCRRRPTGSR